MNDRRLILGLILIMAIATVPTLFIKRQPPKPVAARDSVTRVAPPPAPATMAVDSAAPAATGEDTTIVRSNLYRYAISNRGGRVIAARFARYRSLAPADNRDTLQLLPSDEGLLASTLIASADTIRFGEIAFTASSDSLDATKAPAVLTLRGQSGSYAIELTYTFSSSDYRINATGHITGLGAAGGTLLVGLGNGFRNTEANPSENFAQSGIVTKLQKTSVKLFRSLKPRQVTTLPGPFEWVAVKSKYFVAGFFSYDSTTARDSHGNIGSVLAFPADTFHTPFRAEVAASIALRPDGEFHWMLYAGPMEYDRLSRAGHDFDDVNPYGWSWLRPVVRPLAVVIRSIFVWMHASLGLGYGLVIVLFGLIVRALLWPLSRIAMRSMARMQAIQPMITDLQARYKDNPAMLQQETIKLYREHSVNPFGGCWPMLLPYPVLIAVFFVLAYTIEVRGVSFLWMNDLSRADPFLITPVLMAVTMYVGSKISQVGLPPNPQTKMMTWLMPGMMLLLFARFAAGLNLYYTVQNVASIPQQWLMVRERQRMQGKPVVKKK